jgi:signal transduction histidine kinase/ligand-binding sensor domain-containing protein/CheY-like chemotaxis protein/HPt (histidine-containing phosphotransfer) domain-containing protein
MKVNTLPCPAQAAQRMVRWFAALAAAFCFSVTCAFASGEQQPMMLRHLTVADGLPQANVMSTLRDSQGFIWLGTEEGLARYDGRVFTVYESASGAARLAGDSGGDLWVAAKDTGVARWRRSATLPGNFIWQIAEDKGGDLWIAVKDAGVARWHRSTDTFETFRNIRGDVNSPASDAVVAVLVDSGGRIWMGTSDAGVSILDPATGSFQHLRHDPESPGSLSSNVVTSLALDRRGDVWIGTAAGLDHWLSRDQRLLPVPGVRTKVSHVAQDNDGSIWVGLIDSGLLHMDAQERVLERFHQGPGPALASNNIRAVLRDRAGHLWVGTARGLDLLDERTGQFSHYTHDKGDAASLRDSDIMSLYEDSAGLLWIGTRYGGVSRWNPQSWEMGARRPRWLDQQAVMAFSDAGAAQVWIGSFAGLHRYDTASDGVSGIDAITGRTNALRGQPVTSLQEGQDGSLWIGTGSAGLARLTPDNRLQWLGAAAGKPDGLSAPGVMALEMTRAGQLWVGTFEGGANIVDPRSGKVRQLPFGKGGAGGVSAANVTAILEDPRGNVWLGTEGGGVNLMSADGQVVRVFRNDPGSEESLPSNNIYSLAVDAQGRVWVGTEKGVARLQDATAPPQQMKFGMLHFARGRDAKNVFGILTDPRGGAWISGNAGLTWVDPDRGLLRIYHREDGLQGEEFMFGAYHRLRDGRLAFGGPGGFNIFDAERLTARRAAPQPILTMIEVLGVESPGDLAYWNRRSMSLGYRENRVTFRFAVPDQTAPEHGKLSYRRPNLSEQWIDKGEERTVVLDELGAGDHVLEVRAAGADSPWSEPLVLHIHRDPAPWQTKRAYAAYALVVLLAVGAIIWRQRRKFLEMQRTQEYLESQVELRTSELMESNRQLEEAARAKSDFLDRMSHELRTPMNGVVGMTELLTRTTLSATQSHLTKTIKASAQILLQIVNDLLDLSKIRAGKVELEKLPVDIGQVLEECTSLFTGAAESKGIELIVCPPADSRRALRGDPLRVRQVLMNLVGNAVKFTSQGEIVVRADIETLDDASAMVHLSVTDTGIGIEPAVLAKIFDPFTQADEKTTRQFGGTGLGLAICRELAELMGGRITVESRQQIGSTFCLHLPMTLGEELPEVPPLRASSAELLSRKPALLEALERHCAAFGIQPLAAGNEVQGPPASGVVRVIDASTQEALLCRLLGGTEVDRAGTVVLATPAEAERLGLRVLLPERAVVLKPVHRVALREAIDIAMGGTVTSPSVSTADRLGRLQGHVLLVEDDPVNAAVAEGYLAELGCTAVWVTSAKAAVTRIQTEHFDLVLMDLNMPDMDGFAATARIREHEAGRTRVPVIALTAHDARSYRPRVLAAGMDEILSKPYSLQECHQTLSHWIAAASEGPSPAMAAEPLASVDGKAVAALAGLGSGRRGPLFARLVGLFETSSRALMTKLETAIASGDLVTGADICHRLKSSAANVGAMAFAARVRELEQICRDDDTARAAVAHRQLSGAHGPLLSALHELTKAA